MIFIGLIIFLILFFYDTIKNKRINGKIISIWVGLWTANRFVAQAGKSSVEYITLFDIFAFAGLAFTFVMFLFLEQENYYRFNKFKRILRRIGDKNIKLIYWLLIILLAATLFFIIYRGYFILLLIIIIIFSVLSLVIFFILFFRLPINKRSEFAIPLLTGMLSSFITIYLTGQGEKLSWWGPVLMMTITIAALMYIVYKK